MRTNRAKLSKRSWLIRGELGQFGVIARREAGGGKGGARPKLTEAGVLPRPQKTWEYEQPHVYCMSDCGWESSH